MKNGPDLCNSLPKNRQVNKFLLRYALGVEMMSKKINERQFIRIEWRIRKNTAFHLFICKLLFLAKYGS
jgi:hypothetical protein